MNPDQKAPKINIIPKNLSRRVRLESSSVFIMHEFCFTLHDNEATLQPIRLTADIFDSKVRKE